MMDTLFVLLSRRVLSDILEGMNSKNLSLTWSKPTSFYMDSAINL